MEEPQPNLQTKRRAACDECRTKKLKCTGEQPACARCARENITCVYSVQKRMGRPKKRPRTDEEAHDAQDQNMGEPARWIAETSGDISMPPFDASFTLDGSLEPWLQQDNHAQYWDGESEMLGGAIHNENVIPGLTPDNSTSNSPSEGARHLLYLPPELQSSRPVIANSLQSLPDQNQHHSIQQLLGNPNAETSLHPNCACLSTIYLTLNTLQSMSSDGPPDCGYPSIATLRFPYALHPLREAIQTATTVLSCTECPKRFITGMQNTQLIGTLLVSIAERFHKVLESIDIEAARASTAGETKKFRLADLNTSTSHLHTGGLGCMAAFNLNMTPSEWKSIAKKVVKAEVMGPAEGNECCSYLLGAIEQMVQRQERYHGDHTLPSNDFPKGMLGEDLGTSRNLIDEETGKKREPLCLKMAGFAKNIINGFDWT